MKRTHAASAAVMDDEPSPAAVHDGTTSTEETEGPAKKLRRAEKDQDELGVPRVEAKEDQKEGQAPSPCVTKAAPLAGASADAGLKKRKCAGGCIVAEGYEEVLTFLGTLINEFKPTHVKFPSAILIGSRAAFHWDPDASQMADASPDWNIVILPWALENWLAINNLTVTKPESGLKMYEYVLPNPRLPEAALPRRQLGHVTKLWRVDCTLDNQMIHFDLCAKYLYDQAAQTQPSSNCLLFDLVSNFVISHKERMTAVKPFPGGGKAMVAPLEILEAIKRSHIYWPGGAWHKHICHLHALREKLEQKTGASWEQQQRSPEIEEFLERRYHETEERLGMPGTHLNFDTHQARHMESSHQHRALHRAVACGETPVYEELQRNHVLTMEVFVSLRHESKLKLIREEVMTLALKRYLGLDVDSSSAATHRVSPEAAFDEALEGFCTVLTQGALREFAVDHFPELEKSRAAFVALCGAEEEAWRAPPSVAPEADANTGVTDACPVLCMSTTQQAEPVDKLHVHLRNGASSTVWL